MRPVRAKATRHVLACRAWAGLLTMVLLAGAEAEAAAKPAGAKSALTSRTAFDLGVEEGAMRCKLLFQGNKILYVYGIEGTLGISIG